jgi:hypothetical protein
VPLLDISRVVQMSFGKRQSALLSGHAAPLQGGGRNLSFSLSATVRRSSPSVLACHPPRLQNRADSPEQLLADLKSGLTSDSDTGPGRGPQSGHKPRSVEVNSGHSLTLPTHLGDRPWTVQGLLPSW